MNTATPLVLDSTEAPSYEQGSIYFIGTATVILRYAGFTILTDPNFLHKGDHVHLGYGLHSARRTNPAMNLAQLPPIDCVLLSHLHEDHFDRLVMRDLNKDIPIITTPKAARTLARKGFRHTIGLATWQEQELIKSGVRLHVTSMPGRHGPKLVHAALPPVMGSMLEFEGPTGGVAMRLYISGDTLVYKDIHEIPQRYPNIDLGLLHLGGTRVLGVLVTMDAKQGIEAVRLINPRLTIPIHYDDYTVFKSPLEDFAREVVRAGLQDRVHYIHRGETYQFEVPTSRLALPPEPSTTRRESGVMTEGPSPTIH